MNKLYFLKNRNVLCDPPKASTEERRLGLKVVAKRLETEAQHDLLTVYGCDLRRGYLYRMKQSGKEQFRFYGQTEATAATGQSL